MNYLQFHALYLGIIFILRLVDGVHMDFLPRVLSSSLHESTSLENKDDYQRTSVLFLILVDSLFPSPDNFQISVLST